MAATGETGTEREGTMDYTTYRIDCDVCGEHCCGQREVEAWDEASAHERATGHTTTVSIEQFGPFTQRMMARERTRTTR